MEFYAAYKYQQDRRSKKTYPKDVPELTLDLNDKIITTGTVPFYERIQSHADFCRLDRKIEQYRAGNTLALGVPGGEYGDFSNQPTDLAKVLNSKQEGQAAFEQLPESIRGIFGNSYSEFAKSLQDGSYQGRIEKYAAEQLAKLGAPSSVPADKGTEGGAE